MEIKEKTLSEALSDIRMNELPKLYRDGDEGFWLKAVVLVRKRNATQSYVLANRKGDGLITYVKDYASSLGVVSPISGLIAVYPYIYLDERRFMPDDKDDMTLISKLASYYKKEESEYYTMTHDLLLSQCRDMAIQLQEKAEQEDYVRMPEEEPNDTVNNKIIEEISNSEESDIKDGEVPDLSSIEDEIKDGELPSTGAFKNIITDDGVEVMETLAKASESKSNMNKFNGNTRNRKNR